MTSEEKRMIGIYRRMSDEELLGFIRSTGEELGRVPLKTDFVAFWYLKERFGPWPRILEAAGLKTVTERRMQKLNRKAKRKGIYHE